MKKLRTILFFAFMIAAGTIGVLSSTISWFDSRVKFDANNIAGNVLGKYFAYGSGTKDDPYGITHAIHLYNLSWLQYMGYFEQGDEGPDTLYYFELGNDINANETYDALKVLPPIGTEDNPFIGQLNGNGHTISNFTFANAVNTPSEVGITRIPDKVTNYAPDSNVGIFGKVASLDSDVDGDNTLIKDIGFSNITVKSTDATTAGIVAGSLDGVTQNVAVQSPTLDIVSGDTVSEYTLVGACDDKYTHQVTKVKDSVFDLEVKNLEFTAQLGGKDQGFGGSVDFKEVHSRLNYVRRQLAVNAPDTNGNRFPQHHSIVYKPDGSVLEDTWKSSVTSANRVQKYYDRGTGVDPNNPSPHYSGSYDPMYGAYQYGNNLTGTNLDSNNNAWIHYMAGGHYEKKEYQEAYSYEGCTITDGTNYLCIDDDGTLYNGNSGNGINESNATVWNMPSSGSTGKIYTRLADGGEQYFLEGAAGTLTVNAGSGTTNWYISENANFRTFRTSNYYYLYFSDTWFVSSTIPGASEEYYLIYDSSGHYMMEPTDRLVLSTTSRANAAKWVVSSESNRTFALKSNTDKVLSYYYKRSYFGGTTTYIVQAYTTDDNTMQYRFTGTLPGRNGTSSGKFRLGDYNYYILYQDSASEPWTANGTGSTFTVEHYYQILQTTTQKTTSKNFPYVAINESRTTERMDYSGTDVTYFPLNVNGINNEGLNAYYPTENNTGYIMGGSRYTSLTGDSVDGVVRIAAYGLSSAIDSAYYGNGKIKKVLTCNNSGISQDINFKSNSYQKFNESKESLEGILNGTSTGATQYNTNYTYTSTSARIYGLHFMNDEISKDHLVVADKAQILGNLKTNYEMPSSSIDFNLKDKGYVNFFAGTYMNTTDGWADITAFFSLYDVFRNASNAAINPDKITAIRRIVNIWFDNADTTQNKSHSYVYEYEPETNDQGQTVTYYSVPFRMAPDGNKYQLNAKGEDTTVLWEPNSISTGKPTTYSNNVFETKWIEKPWKDGATAYTKKAFYYFEIPMNPGEFCLGSVSGGTGGYLVYLDIGANAQTIDRTTIIQKFVTQTTTFDYVEGIVVVADASSSLSAIITEDPDTHAVTVGTLDPAGSVSIDISAGYTDSISIARSGEIMTISRAGPPAEGVDPISLQYSNPNITVKESYNGETVNVAPVGKSSSAKTMIRMEYFDVNTTNMGMTHTVFTYEDGATDPSDIKQYLPGQSSPVESGKETTYADDGTFLNYAATAAISKPTWPAAATGTMLELEYWNLNSEETQLAFELFTSISDSGYFYVANSYSFTVTGNGANFKIDVTKYDAKTQVTINRGDQDSTTPEWSMTYTIVINGTSYNVTATGKYPPSA